MFSLPRLTFANAVLSLIVFLLLRAIYRLTLHPLAKFPGPLWARISSIYGMTYDLTADRGYALTFPALHEKYGMVDRIGDRGIC